MPDLQSPTTIHELIELAKAHRLSDEGQIIKDILAALDWRPDLRQRLPLADLTFLRSRFQAGNDVSRYSEGYDESKHPRDDHGRWVDKGELHAAKSDPGKAAELRSRVTKPEERAKLEASIGQVKANSRWATDTKYVDVPDKEGEDKTGVEVHVNPSKSGVENWLKKLGRHPLKANILGGNLVVWDEEDVHHTPVAKAMGWTSNIPFEDRLTISRDNNGSMLIENNNNQVVAWPFEDASVAAVPQQDDADAPDDTDETETPEHAKPTAALYERAGNDPALTWDEIDAHLERLGQNTSKAELLDHAAAVDVTVQKNATRKAILDEIGRSIKHRKGSRSRTSYQSDDRVSRYARDWNDRASAGIKVSQNEVASAARDLAAARYSLAWDSQVAEWLTVPIEMFGLEDGGGVFANGRWLSRYAKEFDESLHPRDDHGRWIEKGEMAAAKKDPKKAAELRARVTKPEERKKLEANIAAPAKVDKKSAKKEAGGLSLKEMMAQQKQWEEQKRLKTTKPEVKHGKHLEGTGDENQGGRLRPGDVGKDAQAGPGGKSSESGGGTEGGGGVRGLSGGDDAERGGPDVRPAARGDAAADGAGAGDGRTTGAGEPAGPVTAENPVDVSAGNFRYHTRDFHKGGAKAKFRANIEAIKTLHTIQSEGRTTATVEEQAVLSKYLGWGQFPNVFKKYGEAGFDWQESKAWQKEAKELKELISDDEWESARDSILNAHFTDPAIVDAQWKMAQRLGFKGGRFLETSAGVGYYLGMMPPELSSKTKSTAVEKDALTGAILGLLYPKSVVQVQGFETDDKPDNFYDLVASNVPFGDYGVHDPRYNKHNALIHDYFFLKSAKVAKPGGLIMHITSTGTMDKGDDSIRRALAEDCDLVSAIRFPGYAHQEGAGTAVVTDLVILRKRHPGEKPVHPTDTPDEAKPKDALFTGITTDSLGRIYHWENGKRVPGPNWMDVTTVPDPLGGDPIPVNKYFADHPEQVLGQIDRTGTMRGAEQKNVSPISAAEISEKLGKEVRFVRRSEEDEETSEANKHGSFLFADGGRVPTEDIDKATQEVYAAKLNAAIARLPAGLVDEDGLGRATRNRSKQAFEPERLPAPNDVLEGGFHVKDGKLFVRHGGALVEESGVSKDTIERIEAHLGVVGAVRALLSAETRGEPSEELRAELNKVYDTFVDKYGFLSERKNLNAFKGDYDNSPVLLALEKYDPKTKTAVKADMFSKATVRAVEAATSAGNVPEALGISLHETGGIDVERMANLTGQSTDAVSHELVSSGLAYRDPSEGWKPADQYLSGNVRQKLALAQAAAENDPMFKPNVEALLKVQPEDLHHTEIGVRIGASWIPKSDIARFAADLISGRPEGFAITYTAHNGAWTANYASERAREQAKNNAVVQRWSLMSEDQDGAQVLRKSFPDLLEAALNNTSAVVKGGMDERVNEQGQIEKFPAYGVNAKGDTIALVNHKDTADANSKVQEIKNAFKDWIWQDDDRRERLHRFYNDNFNNIVRMQYNGKHQKFPGMNPAIKLHPHIPDFVWQVVTTGGGLAAHEVGTGKTYAMITAAMELRRLGLAKKPAIACLKANIEAITKDARLLYPAARILSTADMFTAAKRKETISRIATGDYDLIVMTHDNLNMLQMRPETQTKYIREEMSELESALSQAEQAAKKAGVETKRDTTVKQLVNAKKKLQKRLEKALGGQKDNAVNFEDTGIDHLQVDESHKFKSLPVYTKQGSLKGIPTNRSDRATSMLMRTRWLQDNNNGRGVVFATGTPVTNTLAELYTQQRYLQPDQLKARGIQSFDAWSKLFADTETKAEFTVSGEYKPVTRMSEFINLPELQQITGQAIDVQRVDDINERAIARGEKAPIVRPHRHDQKVVAPKTPAIDELAQKLIARAAAVKARKGPPQKGDDNMLVICTDGRKGSIDMRLLDASAPDDPQSKVNLMVANVLKIASEKPGQTQLIFSDVGVHPSKYKDKKPKPAAEDEDIGAWGVAEADGEEGEEGEEPKSEEDIERESLMASSTGFHLYNDIITKLVKGGIPREKIADFSQLKGKEKEEAQEALRRGDMLIGIGGTQKMGTGVNVQDKLGALHHLDVPWLPADIEQRNGRGVRHGNKNKDIDIFPYITEGSLDKVFWQIVGRKANFISQVMQPVSKQGTRSARDEDSEVLTPDQLMAAASGDPRVMEKVNLDEEVKTLEEAEARHAREQGRMKETVRKGRKGHAEIVDRHGKVKEVAAHVAKHMAEQPEFSVDIGGKTYTDRKEAASAMEVEYAKPSSGWQARKIGEYRGMDIMQDGGKISLRHESGTEIPTGPSLGSVDVVARKLPETVRKMEFEAAKAKADIEKVEAGIGAQFPKAAVLAAKKERQRQLEAELGVAGAAKKEPVEPVAKVAPAEDAEYTERAAKIARAAELRRQADELEAVSQYYASDLPQNNHVMAWDGEIEDWAIVPGEMLNREAGGVFRNGLWL